MIGSILGDIIGSTHEYSYTKTTDFELFTDESTFTDDTVMTIATMQAILSNESYESVSRLIGRKYPDCGYGGHFYEWLFHENEYKPYNSWGNGSAMRVSPIGIAFSSVDSVLIEAKKSAEFTHNHPEGVKGAQATALAVFLAKNNYSKDDIKSEIEDRFGYNLSRSLDEIRPSYKFDVSCMGTVPEAIISFLESTDYVSCIRNAISLGGDADTLACIAGGIAEAYYKTIPYQLVNELYRLPVGFNMIISEFYKVTN